MSNIATIGTIAVQLLRAYLELMRVSGRTPEQAEEFYRVEHEKFAGEYHPDRLPKPE